MSTAGATGYVDFTAAGIVVRIYYKETYEKIYDVIPAEVKSSVTITSLQIKATDKDRVDRLRYLDGAITINDGKTTKTIYEMSSWAGNCGFYALTINEFTTVTYKGEPITEYGTVEITRPSNEKLDISFCAHIAFVKSGSGTDWYLGTSTDPATQTITLPAVYSGLVYLDDGTAFKACQCYIDNGSEWCFAIPYISNGTSWDLIG